MPTSPSNQYAPNTSKLTQHTNQLAPHSQQSLPSSSSASSSSSPSKSSSAKISNQNTTVHQFSSWLISAWSALIFMVALNLRPSIAAVGPVLQQIGSTFGVCTQITANHTLALVVFTGTAVLQCVVAYYAGRK